MTPRQKRQAKTKQAILDTARKLINADGVENLSIRSLAKAIDYSPAGLYEYFGSKEEIIAEVCLQGHDHLYEAMSRVDENLNDTDYLYGLGQAYLQFAQQYPDYFLLIFTTAPLLSTRDDSSSSELPSDMLEDGSAFSILVKALERGVANGTFCLQPDQSVVELALLAWVQVHGSAMLWLGQLRHQGVSLESLGRQAQSMFIKGINR